VAARSGYALTGFMFAIACGGAPSPSGAIDAPPPDEGAPGDAVLDDAAVDDAAAADGAPADAPTDAAGPPWLVPPQVTCPPPTDACAATPAVPGLHASYRKDAWLPEAQYNEGGERPTAGGRVQVAATAAVAGRVTRVLIDGVDVTTIDTAVADPSPSTVPFEWTHVWPATLTAGAPVWVAFHSRAATWDQRTTAHLRIETDGGVAVDADFAVAITRAPITYVTTSDDLATLVVHVQNRDTVPHTMARTTRIGRAHV